MTQSSKVNSVINIGVPLIPPDLFKDPALHAAVEMLLQGLSNLLSGIEQYTGMSQKDMTLWSLLAATDTLLRQNLGRIYLKALENVAEGAFVNLVKDGGILKVQNARSDVAGKNADGYCSTTGGIAIGTFGECILSQGILHITGVTPADKIFLSATPGVSALVPDTAVGHLEQYLGIGVATDYAYIDISTGQYVQH